MQIRSISYLTLNLDKLVRHVECACMYTIIGQRKSTHQTVTVLAYIAVLVYDKNLGCTVKSWDKPNQRATNRPNIVLAVHARHGWTLNHGYDRTTTRRGSPVRLT